MITSGDYGEGPNRLHPFLVNTEISDTEIKEFLKSQLTYFKVPKFYQRIDSFPMTVTGKVQKFKLAERAQADFNL